MLLLLLPWGFAAANAVAAWLAPGTVLIEEPGLFGQDQGAPEPEPSLAGLWSGAYQRAFAAYFGRHLPLLASAMRIKNQVYDSVLDQSGNPLLAIGKHKQLYEQVYIDEYCSRDTPAIIARGRRWAAELRQMQDWYAARGRVFVYVITPSKAATYPEYFPAGQPCPSPPAVRDALGPDWDAVLDQAGVRTVDAAALTRGAKRDYPFELFPPGGTHWNDVASALAAQAVVRRIDAAPAAWKLTDFSFTWHMAPPAGVARDLMDLLNVPYPRLDYLVPVVSIQAPPVDHCAAVNIGAVGGSFTYEMLWALLKLPCPPTIDFYSYFHTTHAAFPGDIRGPVDAAQRDDELLHRAQIVILEENEQTAMRSEHGPAFYDLVAAQFGARR